MNRLLVPALVLLSAVGFPGTAGAQPLAPPPVEPPEILPPGTGAPDATPPGGRPAQGPPATQDDQRDGILPPGTIGGPVTSPVASPTPEAATLGAPVVIGDSTVETTRAAARRRRPLAALNGGVGLLRTSAADVGDRWDLRLGLTGEFSSSEDFLVRGSRNRRLAGTLAAGVTVARQVEVFGALLASSNRNDRCATGPDECVPEPDRLDPTLIRAFGDLVLGGKLAAPLTRALRLGTEAGMRLFAGSDGPGFEGDATSAWVTALGTWDLRPQALPLVLHFNFGFYLDNSGNLQDPARFSSSMLASRSVATFAYGIGRDRLRSSVALTAPMERRVGAVALEPFVEYHVELVTDDPDPAYQAFAPPRCLSGSNCAGNRDQHWLSFGLRTSLGAGFALLGGLDLGVRSPGYPFGSALLPFNVVFGFRQVLGLAPPPPRSFTRTVTVERRVAVASPPASGQVQLEVGAPGFQPQSVSAMVTPGQTTSVQVTLEPVPAPAPSAPSATPVRIEAGRVVTSSPIGFVDEAGAEPALTAEAQATLNQLAPQLAAPSAPAHIRIEAHWDNGLPRAEAEALTRRQAEVVAAYLVERGVPRDRLQPVGLGATRPRVPNLGPTSRSKNRRVELVVGR
jgi:outer membrane protein OmpA-like peptidoglycan-associated protein